MAFLPLADSSWWSSGLGSLTVTNPAVAKPGMRLWIMIETNNGTGITPHASWTRLGSDLNFNGGTSGIYYRDLQPGDPASWAFTTGAGSGNTGWLAIVTKAKGATTVQSDQADTLNATVAAATCEFKAFNPARIGNLRLAFLFTRNQSVATPPTVAPSADNPGKQGFRAGPSFVNTGITMAIWWSLYEDPSGTDANSSTWSLSLPFGNPASYTRAVTLDDGYTDYDGADELLLYEEAVPVGTYDMSGDESSQESADANWWGGGAGLPGDHT